MFDEPVRFVIAGAPGSELTVAAERALRHDPRAELVRVVCDRLASADVADADVLLSAAHSHFIPASIRSLARLGALGLHPSLLPSYRGSWPLWWALRRRELDVGLSLYHLVDRIDAGPVISQHWCPVLPGDTFARLYARVATLVPDVLDDLLFAIRDTGEMPEGDPQNEAEAFTVRTPDLPSRVIVRAQLAARAAWGR